MRNNVEKVNSGNASQESAWDTAYRDEAIRDGMTVSEKFKYEKEHGKKSDKSEKSGWDTVYRDEAIENGMTVAERFHAEQENGEPEVDPEEVEWYQNHLDKIGDLIGDGDLDKEQWYREHPDKIGELVREKNLRDKEPETIEQSDSRGTDEKIPEDAVEQTFSEVGDEMLTNENMQNETTTEDAEPVSEVKEEAPELANETMEEPTEPAGEVVEVKIASRKEKPINDPFLEKVAAIKQREADKRTDENSYGTLAEQRAYQNWLESHDEENLKNLEGREEHVIESDVYFELKRKVFGRLKRDLNDLKSTAVEYNLTPTIINAMRRRFEQLMDEAEEEIKIKKGTTEKPGEDDVKKPDDDDAKKREIEDREKREIEDREKREIEDREKREIEDRERREIEEKEKREKGEKGEIKLSGREKRKKEVKETLARIGERLRGIFEGKNKARQQIEEYDREIALLERRKGLRVEGAAGGAAAEAINGGSDEKMSDFDKAREIYKKMKAIDAERAELNKKIKELKEKNFREKRPDASDDSLKALRREGERLHSEATGYYNEMVKYIHSAEEYDRIISESGR